MEIKLEVPDDLVDRFNHCINDESLSHKVDWDFKQFVVRAFNIALCTYEIELKEQHESEAKEIRKNFRN